MSHVSANLPAIIEYYEIELIPSGIIMILSKRLLNAQTIEEVVFGL